MSLTREQIERVLDEVDRNHASAAIQAEARESFSRQIKELVARQTETGPVLRPFHGQRVELLRHCRIVVDLNPAAEGKL